MSAAGTYNMRAIERGELTGDHLVELVLIAQEALGMTQDGLCGPATRRALELRSEPLGAVALETLIGLLGQGEEGGNNHGPLIDKLGGRQGYLWCALLCGYGWRMEYRARGMEIPTWLFRHGTTPEPGAKALIDRALASGWVQRDPSDARPGDLVLWEREGGHHVGMVEREDGGLLHTIEGNVGPFPARVRRLKHDPAHEPHFKGVFGPP